MEFSGLGPVGGAGWGWPVCVGAELAADECHFEEHEIYTELSLLITWDVSWFPGDSA